MAIKTLAPFPSRVNRPETLDDDTERLFANLDEWATDVDQARAQAVAASEAGANGYSFRFDLSTLVGDPGPGLLRFNSLNLTLATALYLNTTTSTGSDIGALIDTFDDSDSTVKGTLRIVQASNAANWAVYKLSSVAVASTTYRSLQLAFVASSGNNPFAAGVTLALQFAANGDSGPRGIPGSTTSDAVRADLHAMMLSF